MRHNKLAGTRFLLGSRKHKPSTFTSSSLTDCNHITTNNNMLHSKSTYFYRWFGEHLGLVVSGLSAKTSYIVPAVCGAALLGALGLIVSPAAGKTEAAYAATNDDKCMNGDASSTGQCPMELSIMMSGADGGTYEEAGATQLEAGKTSYRSYGFKISATDIDKDGYRLYATAVETKAGEIDYTNQLVNADYPDKGKFVPITNTTGVVGDSITAGEWGYAIAGGNTGNTLDTANTNPGTLTYKAVPTAQTTPIAIGAETTTADSGIPDNPATVPDEYRLIFGAKAAEDMPSGHYRTQVMLSLVADPKKVIVGLGGITKMSEMTSAHCASLKTPATNAALKDIPTGQLIDDREGNNGTKYWVSKFADGDCWMTQNMAYDGISNKTGNFNNTKKNTLLVPYNVNNPTGYTEKSLMELADYALSEDPAMIAVIDEAAKTYNGHYLMGDYYALDNNQAADACSFAGSGWKLPTSPSGASVSAARGSFSRLLGVYNVPDSGTGSIMLRKMPFYFLSTGWSNSGIERVGSYGIYWSSTVGQYGYNHLYLQSSSVSPVFSSPSAYGCSVRCVVSGE